MSAELEFHLFDYDRRPQTECGLAVPSDPGVHLTTNAYYVTCSGCLLREMDRLEALGRLSGPAAVPGT